MSRKRICTDTGHRRICSVLIVIVSAVVPNCCVMSVSQVIFEHEGVFIHPSSDEDGVEQDLLISGTLRIVDKVTALSHVSWPYTVIPQTYYFIVKPNVENTNGFALSKVKYSQRPLNHSTHSLRTPRLI